MLEVPIVDLHLAKLAWAPETGENYDIKIAEKRFMDVICDIVERAQHYEFEQVVFPIGNDFFNYDSVDGATTKGTPQDNDSRWAKMFLKGRELLITAVDLLSQIAPVKVFQIPGNHDYQASWYAIVCLHDWFRNDENVTVDISPKSRKYVEFGKCLIGFTHGDKEKKRIFGNMQVEVPKPGAARFIVNGTQVTCTASGLRKSTELRCAASRASQPRMRGTMFRAMWGP